MDAREVLPPIVVKPVPRKERKRRHPAKVGMLIALAVWPVLTGALAVAVWSRWTSDAVEIGGTQLVRDPNRFGFRKTDDTSLILDALVTGGTTSTFLVGAVILALWVYWFATKRD